MSDQCGIVGYYDDPTADVPAYDPGLDVICPFCVTHLNYPAVMCKTINLMGLAPTDKPRSYFYRCHKTCYEGATGDERGDLEVAILLGIGKDGRSG